MCICKTENNLFRIANCDTIEGVFYSNGKIIRSIHIFRIIFCLDVCPYMGPVTHILFFCLPVLPQRRLHPTLPLI